MEAETLRGEGLEVDRDCSRLAIWPHCAPGRRSHGESVDLTGRGACEARALSAKLDRLEQEYAEGDELRRRSGQRGRELETALGRFRIPAFAIFRRDARAGAVSSASTSDGDSGSSLAMSVERKRAAASNRSRGTSEAPVARRDEKARSKRAIISTGAGPRNRE